MKRKTIFVLVTVMMMAILITAVVAAAPPDRNPASWWWGEVAGTSQIVRTDSGIHGNFKSSVSNEVGSAQGLAVTLWLVVFNEPGACWSTPCNDVDLLENAAVNPDVLYAAGNVVGASEMASFGFSRNAGDNSGSIADLFGLPTNDGESWGLIDPHKAEVHYILRLHGPMVPMYMPAQIQTYGGGCVYNAPYGYDVPADPTDLHLGLGDCQDVQFAINSP